LLGLLLTLGKNPWVAAFPLALGVVFLLAGFWYRRVGTQDG
jgi:hypothetical protein